MVNTLNVAKCLIQLFYKSDIKFSCSRTKLEKLLTIAALTEMKKGADFFLDKITVNQCGTGIPVLSDDIKANIITGIVEENCQNFECEFDDSVEVPEEYIIDKNEEIDSKVEKLLKDIFLKFGSYRAVDIGRLLDKFKDKISEYSELYDRNVLVSNKVKEYFCLVAEESELNDIECFVVNYNVQD